MRRKLMQRIPALIYKLKRNKEKQFYFEELKRKFDLPEVIYGDFEEEAAMMWDVFNRRPGSLGALFTGTKGFGKTTICEILSNNAIKAGLPVIMISEMEVTIDTIEFLNTLKDVVLFFDEFGKNVNRQLQNKMLTVLSGITGGRKLVLLTENDVNYISEFILDRPGRVYFHYHYDRLQREIVDGYCSDNNVKKEIYEAIVEKYEESPDFSLDHLKGMIEYHIIRPDDDFDKILYRLNVNSLTKPRLLSVNSITKTVEENGEKKTVNVKFKDVKSNTTKRDFMSKHYNLWIQLIDEPDYDVSISKDNIVKVEDSTVICENKSYTVVLTY
jgi:hypothetical protein